MIKGFVIVTRTRSRWVKKASSFEGLELCNMLSDSVVRCQKTESADLSTTADGN